MAPRNVSDLSENYRCYNFQPFANISGKFPEILNFITHYSTHCGLINIKGVTEQSSDKLEINFNKNDTNMAIP